MFRKSSGKMGFHPLNIFGDLPGALGSSSGVDPGHISIGQQDSIYLYQLQVPNPCALTEETLHVSQLVDSESVSRKVFKQLQGPKLHLLTREGEVDTSAFDNPNFGKDYMHDLAMIPQSRQRQIVDFLFWWDGEARRLKKLIEEREELTALKASVAGNHDEETKFQALLDRVHHKMATRPSERNAEMERDADLGAGAHAAAAGEQLPAYQ